MKSDLSKKMMKFDENETQRLKQYCRNLEDQLELLRKKYNEELQSHMKDAKEKEGNPGIFSQILNNSKSKYQNDGTIQL